MNARQLTTAVMLASLLMAPATVMAKQPFKAFSGRVQRATNVKQFSTAKKFVNANLRTRLSTVVHPKIKFKNPLIKHIGPIVKKPILHPTKPILHPIKPKWPIVHPFPKPCPGPICRPWPKPYPWPVITPCPLPCPEPICQPYPICEPQPIYVPTPAEVPPAVVDAEPSEPVEEAAEVSDDKLPVITAGQRTGLPGPGFGDTPGAVLVKLGDATLKSNVEKWESKEIVFVAPDVQLMQASRATLVVVLADGSTFAEVPVMLAPRSEVAQQTPANAAIGS